MKLGYLSMLVTLLIWASFFLSLKGGVNSNLTPADIALTRICLPALLLLPLVWRARQQILSVPKYYLLGMFIGCGLPYLLVAGSAMQYVPVSHGSALIPGTLPLFVSGIAVILFKQPLSQHRIFGLAAVLVGIFVFLFSNIQHVESSLDAEWNQTKGHLLLLLGSFMWATFTICARVANLNALVSAGFISLISAIALITSIMAGLLPSELNSTQISEWPFEELSIHIVVQGFGAGLIAAFTYLYAINILGAERAAAFGSATPAIATLLAIPLFGETPSISAWVALSFISIGSLIASNIFMKNDDSLTYQPPAHKAKT